MSQALPPWPTNKAELQDRMHESWADLQKALNSYSDEQMTARQDEVGWTVKDHLAHLIPWERGMIALLQKQPRYEAMGLDLQSVQQLSEDEQNERLQAKYASRSLDEVRDELRRTHEELLAVIDKLSDEDLQRGYSYYQPDEPGKDSGQPILRWVVGNSCGHYWEHLPWIRAIAEHERAS